MRTFSKRAQCLGGSGTGRLSGEPSGKLIEERSIGTCTVLTAPA